MVCTCTTWAESQCVPKSGDTCQVFREGAARSAGFWLAEVRCTRVAGWPVAGPEPDPIHGPPTPHTWSLPLALATNCIGKVGRKPRNSATARTWAMLEHPGVTGPAVPAAPIEPGDFYPIFGAIIAIVHPLPMLNRLLHCRSCTTARSSRFIIRSTSLRPRGPWRRRGLLM